MEEKETIRFCRKCGKKLNLGDAICPNCGEICANTQSTPADILRYNSNLNNSISRTGQVDWKKTFLSNFVPIICLSVGIILFIIGLGVTVPSDYISSYSMTEYVGGDAYNFIIEAGLRGGKIAATEISKCIYICVGLLIICLSTFKIKLIKLAEKTTEEGTAP